MFGVSVTFCFVCERMKKEGGKRMLWAGMQTSKDAAQNNQFHELEGLAELFNLPIKKISAGYAHTLILTGTLALFPPLSNKLLSITMH